MNIFILKSILMSFSAVAALFCLPQGAQQTDGYQLVFLLPLTFLLIFPLLGKRLALKGTVSITSWFIVAFSWMRYVIMPLIGTLSGAYSGYGRLATAQSTATAILLMLLELTVLSLLVFLVNASKLRSHAVSQNAPLCLIGSRQAYIAYSLFAALLFYFLGRQMGMFEFLLIDAGSGQRFGDLTDSGSVMVRAMITTGMEFFVLVVIAWAFKRYSITLQKKFLYYALIFVMLRLLVIVGERRSSQIYLAFTLSLLLLKLFPSSRKSILLWIGLSAGTVLVMMSIYKFFYAFNYSSYSAALTNASITWKWLGATLDSYFFGLKNVASSISYADSLSTGRDLFDFFRELGRNIFGLHFLFKSNTLTVSQEYNLFLYRGTQSTGQLISSLGYGYLYGGHFLSIVFTLFNVSIMFWLERRIKKAKSVEYYYLFSVIFIRFAFSLFSNPMPLINYATQQLVLLGIVIMAARAIKSRRIAVSQILERSRQ